MKRYFLILILLPFCFSSQSQDLSGKLIALYQFPIDFEIQNDQGEMNTKEYLKSYGTKRKTRAVEKMYEIMIPFIHDRITEEGFELLPCDELGSIKANPYGIPNIGIAKAVKACEKADYFLRIAIKDITVINTNAQKADAPVKMRTLTVRCRITLQDKDKNNIKSLEAIFDSGDRIESHRNIGIDTRKINGTDREQEMKIYETCCKMAFLKAMDKWN